MEVGAGAATADAHPADHLTRPHRSTGRQLHALGAIDALMHRTGQVAVEVLPGTGADHHAKATALIVDHLGHAPAPPAAHRGTEGSRDIKALVEFRSTGRPGTDAVVRGVAQKDRHGKLTTPPRVIGSPGAWSQP